MDDSHWRFVADQARLFLIEYADVQNDRLFVPGYAHAKTAEQAIDAIDAFNTKLHRTLDPEGYDRYMNAIERAREEARNREKLFFIKPEGKAQPPTKDIINNSQRAP